MVRPSHSFGTLELERNGWVIAYDPGVVARFDDEQPRAIDGLVGVFNSETKAEKSSVALSATSPVTFDASRFS